MPAFRSLSKSSHCLAPCFDIYVQMLGQLWNVGSNKCSGASSISGRPRKTKSTRFTIYKKQTLICLMYSQKHEHILFRSNIISPFIFKRSFQLLIHLQQCTIDESVKGAASQRRYDITFDGNIHISYKTPYQFCYLLVCHRNFLLKDFLRCIFFVLPRNK